MSANRHSLLAASAALLLLAGCGPIVQIGASGPPAAALLLIEADIKPATTPATGATIAVDLPQLPAMLQTLRLAVRTSDTEVRYLDSANWAETPSRQVQRLIGDTLASRGLAVIERTHAKADVTLSGTLREFTLDVRVPIKPLVRVRFDAQIGRSGTARPLGIRSFETSEPVASVAPSDVAAALSLATNRLAKDLADWTAASL